jgi:hypothetical protein
MGKVWRSQIDCRLCPYTPLPIPWQYWHTPENFADSRKPPGGPGGLSTPPQVCLALRSMLDLWRVIYFSNNSDRVRQTVAHRDRAAV